MIRLLFTLFHRVRRMHGAALFRVGVLTAAILAFSSSGFLYFELAARPDLSWGDATWWSVVTMTTVGYGDLFPESPGGRYLIGFPTMIFGISILGYLLSTVATYLVEARAKEIQGMGEVVVRDHVLVIYYPSLNRIERVVEELRTDPKTHKTPIVVIDEELEELPASLREQNVSYIRGDPSKVAVLERANYQEATHAIFLARNANNPDSDHHTLASLLTIEQMRPEIITVAECIDPERTELFYRAGCDSVLCLAQLSTNLLVQEALDPGVQQVLAQLTSHAVGQQIYMVEVIDADAGAYGEVKRRLPNGALGLGLLKNRDIQLNPEYAAPVQKGDCVICVAASRPGPIRRGI